VYEPGFEEGSERVESRIGPGFRNRSGVGVGVFCFLENNRTPCEGWLSNKVGGCNVKENFVGVLVGVCFGFYAASRAGTAARE
jgi:hypothetical protein